MAEEQNEEAVEEGKGGGLPMGMIIKGAIMVVLPMVLGLVVFLFIIKPRLPEGAEPEPVDLVTDIIPAGEFLHTFPSERVHLLVDDPDMGGVMMMYDVGLAVDSEATSVLIGEQSLRFTGMIADLHKNRTQDEMNDALVQKSIEKQILQGTNDLLRRLSPDADPPMRAVQVFHKFQIVPI